MTKTRPPKGRVRVYFDFTRRTFSAQATTGPKKGLVVWKGDRLTLSDVIFVVNDAGRERVRKTHRKAPHAFVEGEFVRAEAAPSASHRPVSYNPYLNDGFVTGDGAAALTAAQATLHVAYDGRPRVFALKPRVTRAASR